MRENRALVYTPKKAQASMRKTSCFYERCGAVLPVAQGIANTESNEIPAVIR
jgi:hypothetical protein